MTGPNRILDATNLHAEVCTGIAALKGLLARTP